MIQTDLYSFTYKQGTLVPWCKKCGHQNFHLDGKSRNKKQIYECQNCGFRFIWDSDLPNRRFFSNVINFATELYCSIGISLRTISKKFLKFFGIKISHEGIRKWVLASQQEHFVDDKTNHCQTWHVDETYIKIKGKGFWLWIVYCAETKQVLSWHISKGRFFTDAKIVLQKAKQIAGGNPEKIITDGLYQYDAAIKKVTGWHWRTYRKKRFKESGIGKNAVLERVNREVKRRIKWFSTFQAPDGAKAFFKLFFFHFNKNKLNSSELT